MEGTAWIVVVVVAWVTVGLLAALVLARRGHRDPMWYVVGPVLGPIFVPIALERAERRPRRLARVAAAAGPVPPGAAPLGTLTVLVGLDGSAESQQACADALRLLGPQLGTVVLAEVVDYDAGEEYDTGHVDRRQLVASAETRLAQAAADMPGDIARSEVLVGAPTPALLAFAAEEHVDAIVVGRRGRGMSRRLLGSVASSIVRDAPTPVVVGSSPGARIG